MSDAFLRRLQVDARWRRLERLYREHLDSLKMSPDDRDHALRKLEERVRYGGPGTEQDA